MWENGMFCNNRSCVKMECFAIIGTVGKWNVLQL